MREELEEDKEEEKGPTPKKKSPVKRYRPEPSSLIDDKFDVDIISYHSSQKDLYKDEISHKSPEQSFMIFDDLTDYDIDKSENGECQPQDMKYLSPDKYYHSNKNSPIIDREELDMDKRMFSGLQPQNEP